MTNTYDIRDYINDKRVYKSLMGHEIDFSFRPVAIDEMYKKYMELVGKIAQRYPEYMKMHQDYINKIKKGIDEKDLKEMEEKTKDFENLSIDARKLAFSLILLTGNSNKQSFTLDEEWINNNIDPREFTYMINFIMGAENTEQVKKK